MDKTYSIDSDNIITACYRELKDESSFKASDHALVFVARGWMHVAIDGNPVATVGEDECVFIRRDHRLSLIKYPSAETGFHMSIVLFFPRKFLFDYFRSLKPGEVPSNVRRSPESILKISRTAALSSLFESFRPYWLSGVRPDHEWLMMKVTEGLRIVLSADPNTSASLFDFTARWRRDILEFMEQNFMYDLTMEEFALYTGRSLATFKRDFSKISDMTPQRWLTARRLKAAHQRLLCSTDPVNVIMADVGFRNFSHFSKIYRERYGCSPRATRISTAPTISKQSTEIQQI